MTLRIEHHDDGTVSLCGHAHGTYTIHGLTMEGLAALAFGLNMGPMVGGIPPLSDEDGEAWDDFVLEENERAMRLHE